MMLIILGFFLRPVSTAATFRLNDSQGTRPARERDKAEE
jgi:hypothetical protein